MRNDIIWNKVLIIRRCCNRIVEEYANNPENLKNFTKQDSVILNIQRACEAAIDLAMYLVSEKELGLPQSSREAFELLIQNQVISESLGKKLKLMVGFRNIAVHNYQVVNLEIVKSIIETHLTDFLEFTDVLLSSE